LRGNQHSFLSFERKLPAAVEEVGDVGVLLGLGHPDLAQAEAGGNLPEHLPGGNARERDGEGKGLVVFRQADVAGQLRAAWPLEVGAIIEGERASELSRAIGPE